MTRAYQPEELFDLIKSFKYVVFWNEGNECGGIFVRVMTSEVHYRSTQKYKLIEVETRLNKNGELLSVYLSGMKFDCTFLYTSQDVNKLLIVSDTINTPIGMTLVR